MKPKEGPTSPQELQEAEYHCIKESQKSLSNCLKKGERKKLSPLTDSDVIIRVGGRVDKALVSYEISGKDNEKVLDTKSPRSCQINKVSMRVLP